MSKRKKPPFDARFARRRARWLEEELRVAGGLELPQGAVVSDVTQQVANNSYDSPPAYYVDKEFSCVDCGRKEVWTAHQQKWYYEVAKGSLYGTAIRCRNCRRKRRDPKRGDLNPFKHAGSVMKHVRATIEPALTALGFEFQEGGRGAHSWSRWIEYSRPGLTLRCQLEVPTRRLFAEALDGRAEYRIVAEVDLGLLLSVDMLLKRAKLFAGRLKAALLVS